MRSELMDLAACWMVHAAIVLPKPSPTDAKKMTFRAKGATFLRKSAPSERFSEGAFPYFVWMRSVTVARSKTTLSRARTMRCETLRGTRGSSFTATAMRESAVQSAAYPRALF